MRNYAEAATFLGGRQYRTIPSIRSTAVERLDEFTIALRYHGTNVVTYHMNGNCTLRAGGWHTVTTKSRINEYSPAQVYQRDFNWYVYTTRGGAVDFFDGITVDLLGRPFTHAESAFAPVPDEYNARKVRP